jgi:hypothetical protein
MTPAFAGTTPPPKGTAWTLANILALAALVGFAIAGWAVFKEYSWWQAATLVSAIVGLVAVVPFIIGQSRLDVGLSDLGVQINLWMHIVGSAVVVAIVLVPAVNDWVTKRL